MPLTPFQKHKIRRLFAVLDVNRDGRVDRNDYIRRVQALARLSGWTEGSPEYERNLHSVLQEWESVRDSADLDDSGAVTVDEYLRYADIFLDDRDAVRAYARGDVQLLFDAMDTDGDGAITAAEHEAGSKKMFEKMDKDHDGKLSYSEWEASQSSASGSSSSSSSPSSSSPSSSTSGSGSSSSSSPSSSTMGGSSGSSSSGSLGSGSSGSSSTK